MLAVAAASVLYIRGLLVKYEASQPERKVEEQIELLSEAALYGKITNVLSFDEYDPGDDEQKQRDISVLSQKLRGSALSYSEQSSVNGLVYNIISGNEIVARVTLENVETKTKLIVFNFETWKVKSLEPAIIDKDIELPLSMGLKMNGEALEGVKNAETGTATYHVCSLTTPEITVYDAMGNEAAFDSSRQVITYAYKVSVPSNYTVYAGWEAIDSSVATSQPISDYEYVYEYCPDMPTQLTYNLYFLENNAELRITDNRGEEVPFVLDNRSVTIEGQAKEASIPGSIKSQIDVLDAAQKWSLFMTDDLTGKNNGYATMNKLLIDDSYLQEVAWKWATGIDITFTSPHKLGKDPFVDEEITDFVKYGDKCFSCTVRFKKHMILSGNMTVMDPMDSTFYFVNVAEDGKDPVWLIADIRENVSK